MLLYSFHSGFLTRTNDMPYSLKKGLSYLSLILTAPYAFATSFIGMLGVDYQPNHYPNLNQLNYHDVFVVGSLTPALTNNLDADIPITNVFVELAQLKAAGFTTVRSYQTTDYSWVDIINQAHRLGMKVIYEADIPQQPSDSPYVGGCPTPPANQDYIPCAQTVLNTVINTVTPQVFQDTVVLVFAGHENYCNPGNVVAPCTGSSNVGYLTSAVSALQSTLSGAGLTTPVSSALISPDFTTSDGAIIADMQTLVASYSPDAPLAFDPYPFQWGVTPASAVWLQPLSAVLQLTNSLAWDYLTVVGTTTPPAMPSGLMPQAFYTPAGRALLSAETGWATQGSTAAYACNSPGPCEPSVANAVTYYQALYQQTNAYNFVGTSGYPIGVLAFEAYDEPSKATIDPTTTAEGYYGIFDSNCFQKAAGLVPNNIMVPDTGCQGFSEGALLTIVGFGHPYTMHIKQTNPVTQMNNDITISSTGTPGPLADAQWPQYLVFPGATITIRGSTSCTSTVQSISSPPQKITFSANGCNCPSDGLNNCYY